MQPLEIEAIAPDTRERLLALDVLACQGCGACASGCPIPGTPGMDGWDPRVALRLINLGRLDAVLASDFPWVCTCCGRCTQACPMGIDIASVVGLLRTLSPRDRVPGTLEKGVAAVLESGNNLSIPLEDYLDTLEDIGGELAEEECPGILCARGRARKPNHPFFPQLQGSVRRFRRPQMVVADFLRRPGALDRAFAQLGGRGLGTFLPATPK